MAVVRLCCLALAFTGVALATSALRAQSTAPAPGGKAAEATPVDLAKDQQQIAKKFADLQQAILKTSEVTAATDPRRAAVLRQTYAESSERAIEARLANLVKLLGKEQLFEAARDQTQLDQDLHKLLELLLSGDRDRQIPSEKARLAQVLKQVNRLIKEQRSVQGRTDGAAPAEGLAKQQAELAEKTGELGREMEGAEAKSPAGEQQSAAPQDRQPPEKTPGEQKSSGQQKTPGEQKSPGEKKSPADQVPGSPSEAPTPGTPAEKPGESLQPKPGQSPGDKPEQGSPSQQPSGQGKEPMPGQQSPPGEPSEGDEAQPEESGEQPKNEQQSARKRIQVAEQKMRSAQKKLEEAKKTEASGEQAKAVEELELAKAELERVLRQLREEEAERVLAMLESRFRKMLVLQTEVYEATQRLAAIPPQQRSRENEIESGRLSRQEAAIVVEADRALNVMKEEGSAVALPEAVMQMREDMQNVVELLSRASIDAVTIGVETDILAALEEMIAALQKARKEQQEKKGQPQQAGEGGEPTEPPLVDRIAELKMIRALQVRVNNRTSTYAKLLESSQSEQPELRQALGRLAERQSRIHSATRDIVAGRNQ